MRRFGLIVFSTRRFAVLVCAFASNVPRRLTKNIIFHFRISVLIVFFIEDSQIVIRFFPIGRRNVAWRFN